MEWLVSLREVNREPDIEGNTCVHTHKANDSHRKRWDSGRGQGNVEGWLKEYSFQFGIIFLYQVLYSL